MITSKTADLYHSYFRLVLEQLQNLKYEVFYEKDRVSVQGVESLWGPGLEVYSGRLGVIVVNLCYFALSEDFSL